MKADPPTSIRSDQGTGSQRPHPLQRKVLAEPGQYTADLATGAWVGSAVLDGILGISNDFPRDSRAWVEMVDPRDRPRCLAGIRRALRLRRPFDIEFRIRRQSDLEIRWLSVTGIPECAPEGAPVRVAGTVRDVTCRRAMEAAAHYDRALFQQARSIFDSTRAQLASADERMRHLATQAELAKHAKNEFLATMSHELRTPLNGMLGMCDLLLDTDLSDEQREFTESIQACGHALLGSVDHLLDFASATPDDPQAEAQPFHLRDLFQDAVAEIEDEFGGGGQQISCLVEPSLPPVVCGDPSRLRKVVDHLLASALRSRPHRHLAIRVVTQAETKLTVTLCVSMYDGGAVGPALGAKPARGGSLPASPGSSSVRGQHGTGLGLVVARELVVCMGGTIGVDRGHAGEESSQWFTVVLRKRVERSAKPADPSTPPAQPVSPPVARPEPSALVTGRPDSTPVRILVVEDSRTNQAMVLAQLRKLGYATGLAADGEEALTELQSTAYDLVLMDCELPVLDGYDTSRRIRTAGSGILNPGVPIIAVTGHAMAGDRQKCLLAGMNDYLSKPIAPDALAATIRRWLPPAGDTDRPLAAAPPTTALNP